ncbi:MAG: ABC transporter permease [Candidatus Parcubacteria bacterium]|nr:ABC transporter permease [Candidatus Parcubacteria bacterium]
MKKFLILLQKEIRELITPQIVLPLVIMVVIFSLLGNLLGKEQERITAPRDIAIVDEDKTQTSESIIQTLSSSNFNVIKFEDKNIENIFSENKKITVALAIPQGFEKGIKGFQQQKIEIYNNIKNFSLLGTIESSILKQIMSSIVDGLSNQILSSQNTNINPDFLKNPINVNEFVMIKDRQANISIDTVMNFIRSQTAFIPIILFMVIMLAAQMVATTVAAEKENKTLETLLSSPISRKTIVLAKIAASGIVALIFAGIFMFGFNSYINGITGSMGQANSAGLNTALSELQLGISLSGYIILGISLFLATLCALAIAIILGILAEDVKGVQAVTTPLMILLFVPYLLSMFFDINSAAPAIKYIIYAIPFSHPFLVPQNLIMHNFPQIIFGIVYQLVLFIILITVAAKIFSSDKVITMKFSFKKKRAKE